MHTKKKVLVRYYFLMKNNSNRFPFAPCTTKHMDYLAGPDKLLKNYQLPNFNMIDKKGEFFYLTFNGG